MRVLTTISSIQKIIHQLKFIKIRIGFVPTMGALHEGHSSLIRRARKENDFVITSIFVNPAQFEPGEDFKKYPRKKKSDLLLAKREKVDIIFYPSVEEMFPAGPEITVNAGPTGKILCGKSRPGHFNGVVTIVAKLLNCTSPDVLYLGQKDYQQAIIIKRMVANLNFPSTIRICSTVREKDGLALSSRNEYMKPAHRKEAVVLYRSLKMAKNKISLGQKNAYMINQQIKKTIRKNSSGVIDYVECVNADTLTTAKRLRGKILIALAVRFGKARLIDNIVVHVR